LQQQGLRAKQGRFFQAGVPPQRGRIEHQKGAGSAPEPIGAKPGHSRGGDMSYIASTPSHCPGFTTLKNLKSFSCKCPNCGELKEIFSDEFARPQKCLRCGQDIDFSKCTLEGAAMFNEPA
jgi:hypothetical protein